MNPRHHLSVEPRGTVADKMNYAMKTITEQTKTDPVLADRAIATINTTLKEKLWWLDQAFGRTYKITRLTNGKRYTEPCVYTSGNEYFSLVPTDDLGNFSFFALRDPQQVEDGLTVTIPYSLIVFVDLRKCFAAPDSENRHDTENIKDAVLRVLRTDVWLKDGAVSVTSVYEEPKNVYKGYTLDETDNQFAMHPYACFRFDGEMRVLCDC